MTTAPRFTKMLSLTEMDQDRTEALRKAGVKIIDIYRAGLETMEKQVKKEEK